MTTVFFTESSPHLGGQELQLLQQARELGRRGHAALILGRPGGRLAEEAARLGVPLAPVDFRNALHPPSLARVLGLLRAHRPAAVVCHSGHDSNVCALAARLLARRPRLLRMRTYQPGPAKPFTYNRLFDLTLTPSEALRAQLLAAGPGIRPGRVRVLPPGIDFARLRADAAQPLPDGLRARIDAPGRGPVIAHAAMLRGEKGHVFLLEVVRRLVDRFPGLLYVAAGEGPEHAPLVAAVDRLGLQDHVVLAGTLRPVAPLLARADVVVMPSHYEPLGMSQIEALGLGTPVVVSDVGGLPETVTEGITGRVCPAPSAPGAVEAWAAALAQVLSDAATARAQAARGRDAVQARFGLEANLAGLLAAVDTAAG